MSGGAAADTASVYVVDDDPTVRKAALRLLRAQGLTAQAFESGADLLAQPLPDGVACILVDLAMPVIGGLDLQQRLRAAGVHHPLIFMSGCGDVPSVARALKAGAVDFLVKPIDEQQLLAAIAAALAHAEAAYARRVAERQHLARFDALTPCEKKVCLLVSEGRLNKQIANELSTSLKTTKTHRGRVMSKLGVRSVADLVRFVDRIPGRDAYAEALQR